jgi:ABC-type sulfate/molybdate transport systems ATPase subunit
MPLLELQNVCSEPLLGGFSLQQINLVLEQGKKLALIGETGTGKSTLLKTIAGLLQHSEGKIIFNGNKCLGPNWQLIPGVDGIGYLSQHFELRNNYRMEELLEYANELTTEEAQQLFDLCEISHLMKRNSYQLSGGEKQRIAFARLLINKPKLLILDEPYNNLDVAHATTLKRILETACEQYNITCFLASHNPADILPWAEELIVLKQGKIVQQGSCESIYYSPVDDYVAGLLGEFTVLQTELANALELSANTILRPNQFQVSEIGVPATVKRCNFLGSHYLVVAEACGQEVVVYHHQFVSFNSEVYLSIKPM